ncbi:MAG TPA: hypothetical protein VN193_07055 [Candidatus Angelobacter sp.]|jgi:hypothetical protein|nr:hypothetical protein [Candidatus Angelobacter sp.]
MDEPVEVRDEQYVAGRGTAPVAAGAPVAGRSYSASRTAVVPVGYRARQLIWLFAGIVNAILALRFIFLGAGAQDSGFAGFIYAAGSALSAPFRGIFGTSSVGNGHPLEWADLVAIAIYTLAAWIVAKLVMISLVREDRAVV